MYIFPTVHESLVCSILRKDGNANSVTLAICQLLPPPRRQQSAPCVHIQFKNKNSAWIDEFYCKSATMGEINGTEMTVVAS